MSIKYVFLSVLVLTLISGAAATWLATTEKGSGRSRNRVADRLAQIALLGAAAIFALLGAHAQTEF